MILCDTNILIELYKNNEQIITALKRIGVSNIAISVVTTAELYYGALNKTDLQQIKKHLSTLHQYPLTVPISQKCLALLESYVLSHKLSLPDALIAATALIHDVELLTLNVKDFHYINGIKLYTIT